MKIKVFHIYITILILYYFAEYISFDPDRAWGGTEISSRMMLQQSLSVILILIPLPIIFRKSKKIIKSRFYRTFYFFGLIAILSYVYHILISNTFSLYFFAQTLKIIYWILPIFWFHEVFISMSEQEKVKILKTFVVIYIIQTIAILIKGYSYINSDDEIIYALGSGITFIIPLVFVVYSKRVAFWIYLICLGIAIVSLKRTPILLLIISFLFLYRDIFKALKWYDILSFGIIVLTGLVNFISRFYALIVERNAIDIAKQGYGSGRSIFYLIIIEEWKKENLISQIFGNGIGSVNALLLEKYGLAISAHNGYLDALYSYGLIGILVFVSIFYRLFKNKKLVKRFADNQYKVFIMFTFMWLIQSFITHGYFGTNFIAYSFFIAYIFSTVEKNQIYCNGKISSI
ncbi:MAG: hypothetical protein ACK5M7_02800 [Draconibacterium sp.]